MTEIYSQENMEEAFFDQVEVGEGCCDLERREDVTSSWSRGRRGIVSDSSGRLEELSSSLKWNSRKPQTVISTDVEWMFVPLIL